MRVQWGLALAACALLACAPQGQPPESTRAARVDTTWLREGHPYLYPRAGRLRLFTCRWSTENPIGVYIDAPDDLREVVRSALSVWQGLALGVRFYEVLAREAALHLYVQDEPVSTARGFGTGRTVTDCAVEDSGGEGLRAELTRARVDLSRETPADARGQARSLSDAEFAGAALHELGHALGFQGHTARRGAVLSRDLSVARRLGKRVLSGERIDAPELLALYQTPSGHVLKEVSVDAWRTDLIDRMARLASEAALEGPFARVGDAAARVFWRDDKGLEYGFQIPELERTLRTPEKLLVLPEARARAALPRSRDLSPASEP